MDEVRSIAQIYLSKLQRQMERQGKKSKSRRVRLICSPKGLQLEIRRAFPEAPHRRKVKLPITTMWKSAARFVVDVEDGEITIKPDETAVSVN
jgi:hypothetical protein